MGQVRRFVKVHWGARRRGMLALVLAASLATVGLTAAGASAASAPSMVPGATPGTQGGEVLTFAKVGGTMFAGGDFTSAKNPGGAVAGQKYLIAFNPSTGAISTTFNPSLDAPVQALLPGPTSNTLYVAGNFTKVNGLPGTQHLVLLDATTGVPIPTFRAPSTNGVVNTIKLLGNRLFAGGFFTTAGGQSRGGLASFDATTGVLDTFLNIPLTGHHNDTGSGAQGGVGAKFIDANAQGDRLVVTGNFKKAGSLARDQVVMIDISGATAAVRTDWATLRYTPYCAKAKWDSYIRQVSFSPDGKFLVITAMGGPSAGTLCDAAARFETYSTGTALQPTWSDLTGGDSLYANAITDSAVFVGGHPRFLNNPAGNNTTPSMPGAVPRAGIAALDPASGLPLAWNPGKNPRGEDTYAIYPTDDGVYFGYDTDFLGNRQYFRQEMGFFPFAGGKAIASDAQGSLPGDVYLAGETSGTSPNTLARTSSFSGTGAASPQTNLNAQGIDWGNLRGGFLLDGTLYYGYSDGKMYKRSLTGSTFGGATQLNPYHDPAWKDVSTGVAQGTGTFDGTDPSFYGTQVKNVTGMFYANDRIYYTLSGNASLQWRWFNADSGIVGAVQNTVSTPGVTWTDTKGMFFANNKVFKASSATGGPLRSFPMGANGVPTGSGTVVGNGVNWNSRALFVDQQAAPPVNGSPTANFTSSCTSLSCSFTNTSSDPDGDSLSYAWDFGDSTSTDNTSTAKDPSHVFSGAGSYDVTLTVKDPSNASDDVNKTVTVDVVDPADEVSFVAGTSKSGTGTNPNVTAPSGVQVGDQLLLTGTYNTDPVTVTAPSGWTEVSHKIISKTLSSYVWTKVTDGTEPGTTTTPATNSSGTGVKFSLTEQAFRNVDSADPIATFGSSTDSGGATHTSPTVTTTAPSFVTESWQVKSSVDVDWDAPAGVTERTQTHYTGGGQTSVLDGDSAGMVAAGTVGGHTATANTSGGSPGAGINWTIALAAAP
jgi:PKD repeat protein